MLSCAKEIRELLELRRTALVDLALVAVAQTPVLKPYSRADLEQMIAGVLVMMFESLEERGKENFDFFVETLIPGLITGGEELSNIVHATLIFSICLTSELSQQLKPEHQGEVIPWLANFWGEYVSRLVASAIATQNQQRGT